MTTSKGRKSKNPIQLVGSWFNGDEYETDVEYIVARSGGEHTVRAVDRFDGEEGTVYDVHYDDTSTILSFNVLWKSTGRFLSVQLLAISPNRASFTYTYTDKEMWFRRVPNQLLPNLFDLAVTAKRGKPTMDRRDDALRSTSDFAK